MEAVGLPASVKFSVVVVQVNETVPSTIFIPKTMLGYIIGSGHACQQADQLNIKYFMSLNQIWQG
jgi:hypothetical protein